MESIQGNPIIICIWDQDENNVYTKPLELDVKNKELKLNGRKPSKVIVPNEVYTNKKLMRTVKKIAQYKALIIKATDKSEPIK